MYEIINPPVGPVTTERPARIPENTGRPVIPNNMYINTEVKLSFASDKHPTAITPNKPSVNGIVPIGIAITENIHKIAESNAQVVNLCVLTELFIILR